MSDKRVFCHQGRRGEKLWGWLMAARLRTLPLALSSIFVGAGLASMEGQFDGAIFSWALITALLLQLLSNLANDLGDAQSGADNAARVGPLRAVQSGVISALSMRRALYWVALLAMLSGGRLIWLALADNLAALVTFILLGLGAILAAIGYTMGKRPYGYRGFGDIAVFLFFGLLGVLGSYYLFTLSFSAASLLPAISCGLLATAVLNVNNLRDEHGDRASGKETLVVKLGGQKARLYHLLLIILAMSCSLLFLMDTPTTNLGWLAFLILPLFTTISYQVFTSYDPMVLNRCLKQTAMASLLYNSLFAIGIQMGY